MPTDVATVTAVIIFIFIVFVAALAWGDYWSSSEGKKKE
jgi:hypothetical protein